MQKKKLLLTAALLLLPIPARALLQQLRRKPDPTESTSCDSKDDYTHKSYR
jgi:hypothetical protein